ncbi:MAG: Gfo/Idh/MocA family oxidoreductase [Bacillaceae bacterium]|nr:Gfo/Idh/MocA family oxidoreductase [Bacillaceae bacterium]
MKVGVIGTGQMGEHHVRVYSELQKECELAGIYDQDENRARLIAQKYHTQSFQSIQKLLKNVDAVSIAVPTRSHYEVASLCMDERVPILLEKPITSTIKEGEKLVRKAEQKNVYIQVGHIELYNPVIEVLKNILADETIIAVDIHRLSPEDDRTNHEDVVKDFMIHDLYILQNLLKDQIRSYCSMGKLMGDSIQHAVVVSKFNKGVIAQMTASFQTEEKIRSIRVIGKNVFVHADLINQNISITRPGDLSKNHQEASYHQENIVERVEIPKKEPLKSQIYDFIQRIKNNKEPAVSARDGLSSLALAQKISEEIRRSADHI